MNIRVKLFGDVATVAGSTALVASVGAGGLLSDLLTAIDESIGRPVSDAILDRDGRLLPSIAVLINGSNVFLKQGLTSPLADGDTVSIMPLMGGGAE